jgi:hypothetical protein
MKIEENNFKNCLAFADIYDRIRIKESNMSELKFNSSDLMRMATILGYLCVCYFHGDLICKPKVGDWKKLSRQDINEYNRMILFHYHR